MHGHGIGGSPTHACSAPVPCNTTLNRWITLGHTRSSSRHAIISPAKAYPCSPCSPDPSLQLPTLTQCAVTTTMAFGFDGSNLAAPLRKVAREAWEGWPRRGMGPPPWVRYMEGIGTAAEGQIADMAGRCLRYRNEVGDIYGPVRGATNVRLRFGLRCATRRNETHCA